MSGGASCSLRALFRSPEKRENNNNHNHKPFPQAIIEQHSFFSREFNYRRTNRTLSNRTQINSIKFDYFGSRTIIRYCTTLFNQFEFAIRLHTEPIKLNQTNPTKTELSQTNAIDFLLTLISIFRFSFFAQISRPPDFPRVEFLAGDRILVQKEKEKFIVGFYVLYNETSHEEILPGLGRAGTEKKGTKKYAVPAKLLSWTYGLFLCRFYRC